MNDEVPSWAHSAVSNYRAAFHAEHGRNSPLLDHEIFSIMVDNAGYADSREEAQAIVADMIEKEKETS